MKTREELERLAAFLSESARECHETPLCWLHQQYAEAAAALRESLPDETVGKCPCGECRHEASAKYPNGLPKPPHWAMDTYDGFGNCGDMEGGEDYIYEWGEIHLHPGATLLTCCPACGAHLDHETGIAYRNRDTALLDGLDKLPLVLTDGDLHLVPSREMIARLIAEQPVPNGPSPQEMREAVGQVARVEEALTKLDAAYADRPGTEGTETDGAVQMVVAEVRMAIEPGGGDGE